MLILFHFLSYVKLIQREKKNYFGQFNLEVKIDKKILEKLLF